MAITNIQDTSTLKTALSVALGENDVTISPVTIRGEPIVVSIALDDATLASMQNQEEIKYFLTEKLAKEMYASGKYIEFTRQEMPHKNETVFRARIFVTPGDITQLLRTEGVIK